MPAHSISKIVVSAGVSEASLETQTERRLSEDQSGWVTLPCAAERRVGVVRVELSGSAKIRVRQIRVFAPARTLPLPPPNPAASRAAEALKVFRDLASEVKEKAWDCQHENDRRNIGVWVWGEWGVGVGVCVLEWGEVSIWWQALLASESLPIG